MKAVIFALFLVCAVSIVAADSTSSNISLRTYLEQDGVPLNKEVVYHVELSWEGDLQRYQITRISEPVLNNLKLRGSGSSNQFFTDEQGAARSVKRITYYFTPMEMGMAYVDGLSVQYEDKITLQSETLMAQRLGVKIIEAEASTGVNIESGRLFVLLLAGLFVLLVAYFLFKFYTVRKREQIEIENVLTTEELYQQELTEILKLSGADIKSDFSKLSQLLKRYFSEKFNIPLTARFAEVHQNLSQNGFESELIKKLEKLYQQSELSKFAGEAISEAEFHMFADTVELVIKSQQNQSIEGE